MTANNSTSTSGMTLAQREAIELPAGHERVYQEMTKQLFETAEAQRGLRADDIKFGTDVEASKRAVQDHELALKDDGQGHHHDTQQSDIGSKAMAETTKTAPDAGLEVT